MAVSSTLLWMLMMTKLCATGFIHRRCVETPTVRMKHLDSSALPPMIRPMLAHPPSDLTRSPGSPQRILIVEDDVSMARAINRVLRQCGYETIFAGNGFLAGSLLHTFRPMLMTLDIRMPWIDGLDVLRLVRQTPLSFDLKILVISGDTHCLDEALAAGVDGVLAKPFTNEELVEAVRGQLGAQTPSGAVG